MPPSILAWPRSGHKGTFAESHGRVATLRENLIKIEAKLVSRSKTLTFQMTEVAVPRTVFAAILERIDRLRLIPGTG